MDHHLSGVQRRQVEQEYLRNGIPSIILAVVTIVLTAYSFWYVQPNIESHYRQICDNNFQKLGLTPLLSSCEDGTRTEASSEKEKLSPDISRSLMTDTQLCLRRLSIREPKNDLIRFEMGVVAIALEEWYRERAWDTATSEAKSDEINMYLARQKDEIGNAVSSMRVVMQMKGPLAARAAGWIVEINLRNSHFYVGELDELQAILQGHLNNPEPKFEDSQRSGSVKDKAVLKSLLARIATIRATIPDIHIRDSDRLQWLGQASESFTSADRKDLLTQSWRAFAELPINRDRAQDWAWGAVQDFWTQGIVVRPTSEMLDAVFRGLLIGGNFEEAQSFVFNHLKKIPSFEQSRLRELAAATCLRQLVMSHLIELSSETVKAKTGAVKLDETSDIASNFILLDLAVRLQPEAPGLPELLIALTSTSSEENQFSLANFMLQIIDSSPREGLAGILEAIRMAKSDDSSGVAKAIAKVTQDDIAYGVLATKVAMILSNTKFNKSTVGDKSRVNIDHQTVIQWLRSINDGSPELFSAWFARGSLHLNAMEFDQAIECFEFLAKRLPDNEQVQEMLVAARVR